MSFSKIARRTMVLGLVVAGSAVGGALACGPFFPWQLLDNRAETVRQPIETGFGFEISRIAPAARDDLRVSEPRSEWSNPPPIREVVTTEEQEAKSGAWKAFLPPESANLDADELLARLHKARGFSRGKVAIDVGEGLPEAVLLYIAGAVEFGADRFDQAQAYFEQISGLPEDKQSVRAVAAAYMQGVIHQIKGEMDAARLAFQATRAKARAGAPDPMGLAVASFGEEARIDLVEAGLLESPWTKETAPDDGPRSAGLIAQGVELYLEQAARGSQVGLQSLREVASIILDDEDLLGRVVASPEVRRVLVAYVVARDDHGWDETPSTPSVCERLLAAVLAQAEPVAGDDIDRLAAVAYRAARYDEAERLVKTTTRPLGLWVRAKLALRRDDRAAAVRDWNAALVAAKASGTAGDLDRPAALRMRGEAAVAELSAGHYRQSLDLLLPVAKPYWGDVAYIAERILTIDELKKFVDALPATPVPKKSERVDDDDFVLTSDPVRDLQWLLARRLMRAGRYGEALAYFEAAQARKPADADEPVNPLAEAKEYIAALEAVDKTRPWQNVTRAEALLNLAALTRKHGMELMGTEGFPDMEALGGDFAYGAGQKSPRGWAGADRYDDSSVSKSDVLLGPDEIRRFDASAPKPNVRFHYRGIAADQALAAADLLPQRSQAYAVALCWAAKYAFDSNDPKRARSIYQRYVKTGAYLPGLPNVFKGVNVFGQECGSANFDSARTFWLRRLFAGPMRLAGSAGRHPVAAAGAVVGAAAALLAGLLWLARRRRAIAAKNGGAVSS